MLLFLFLEENIEDFIEAELAYIVSDTKDPTNHPIYARTTGVGSSILHMVDSALPT